MTQPISIIAKALVRERQRTGLSLAEISRRAGIAKSTLSQLESGNGNPSIETLWSLCVALDIPFARLMEQEVSTSQVIRFGEGPSVTAEMAHYKAILLATCPPGARRDIYQLITQPGEDRHSHPHSPGSIEHLIVTQGRALVGPTDSATELNPGDYICYPGDQPHVFKALEPNTHAILISEQN
ncbi:helix-turn-helix domain-containing protein [Rouxiella badensis]|jgi:transcriptional regulator with XRE-family HTH domain|uniref:Transcriptional regulator n=1 Tax=Rouxiella badensis TaxID=1646377 RepID=A0A1X0WJC0_9GAMM|nr:helix-turn-helix domain-containing protein [Rouxiella badensis]MCC3702161.1 helix-turn-helix domain-containing protein [Rouxiella badensis]MCC3717167.1 helix-turn-helix domain-containing protein [Rouxiella badensis]MCC3728263.1 helix-turn-helix domain-containing protein [Rouxiella badensis]MCC3732167.1 helix-turn-helix domain-containing protein [Rouxiella badensis]MCC3740007.1 helix-turn-helix domain-containing protein [Rouxiella badensis]